MKSLPTLGQPPGLLALVVALCLSLGCGINARRPGVGPIAPEHDHGIQRPVLDLHDIWDRELERMTRTGARQGDVSVLLGGEPEHCEHAPDASPTLGLDLEEGSGAAPVVSDVRREGPAEVAGVRRGMSLVRVEGVAVSSVSEASRRVRDAARVGVPIQLATPGRQHEVIPMRRDALLGDRKCYWTPTHGSVGAISANSIIGREAGSGEVGAGPTYRVACRFRRGELTICATVHGDEGHSH